MTIDYAKAAMKRGGVVLTKSLTVVFGDDGKSSAVFKAPKGQQFVLVLLGVEDTKADGRKLDPVAALKAIGWRPEREPDPALAEAVRLLAICDEQRRRETHRGIGEFGASAAAIDFRRGLDGKIADFLAAHSPSAAA
jgi:hypothetical protein